MSKALVPPVTACDQTDPRFQLLATFNLTVPSGYFHSTRLVMFQHTHGSKLVYYEDDDSQSTVQLIPGRRFMVKVFHLTQRMSFEDYLAFLKKQGAILVGAQGISLAYELAKDKLPKGYWYVSFDERWALWITIGGYHQVPCVLVHLDGSLSLCPGNLRCNWRDDTCLLCFCDPPAEA